MSKVKSARRKLLLPLVAVASGAALVGGASVAHADSYTAKIVHQNGGYVANLCVKNKSKDNIETCTGKVPKGSVRELDIAFDPGDYLEFIVAVEAGHNAYYHIADRDYNCYATGTSLNPNAYCRVDT